MSETYADCEITEDTTDRLVILFALIFTRKMQRMISLPTDIKTSLIDRLDDLIDEFTEPYGDDIVERESFASAPHG